MSTDGNGKVDLADLATIGAEIAELGVKLKGLREQRDVLNKQIQKAEAELMPLVVKHSKIIASITGEALPKAPAPPKDPAAPEPPTPPGGRNAPAKKVIMEFIQTRAQVGMSAQDIADALHVDVMLVRECMGALIQAQRGSPPARKG